MANPNAVIRRRPKTLHLALAVCVAVAVLGLPTSAQAFPEAAPFFQLKWGSEGNAPGQFTNLEFLATDTAGNVYASDAYPDGTFPGGPNFRIQKFSPNGTLLTEWGGFGSGDTQFTRISYVAVDSNDVVYVVENSVLHKRVKRFTSSGSFIDAPTWLQFNNISFILFDPLSDDVLAVSHDPNFVRRFSSTGTLLDQFNVGALPRSGVVDSAGDLYIALNRGAGPIEKYSPSGTLLATFSGSASQLAIDAAGNLYGASTTPSENVIRKYSPTGTVLAEWGGTGTADGEFMTPTGMAVSADGYVFVGEFDGHRIQRFGPENWTLAGFYQPVDMGGVLNTVKAGSTVPLKFEIFDGSNEITSTASITSFTTKAIVCPGAAVPVDEIEFATTGGTSLRYDTASGQFVQNWRTPKTLGCHRVTLETHDGSRISADFRLK